MRVLLVTKFLHYVGGVETYVQWLARSLVDDGHEIALVGMAPQPEKPALQLPAGTELFTAPSRSYAADSDHRVRDALASVYSPAARQTMEAAIRSFRPDVAHFHSTCHQLTPSIFHAAARHRLPSVMTAHEYKLVCANQVLYDDRAQTVCTACVGVSAPRKFLAITSRRCIKGSIGGALLGAVEAPISTQLWGRTEGTVLAPSAFMAGVLRGDGLPSDRVEHLELPWPEVRVPEAVGRDSVLYFGRIEKEKGIFVALDAWAKVHERLPGLTLRIAGAGNALDEARHVGTRLPRVEFLGHLQQAELARELDRSVMTVHPSLCNENSPFSVRESLCAAVPAVVSRIGGMPELVDEPTGRIVSPGDVEEWAEAILAEAERAIAGADALLSAVTARRLSPTRHLESLVAAYQKANRSRSTMASSTQPT
ncbi:MAG TPA: glycosyltransferase [Mycobacteriales bacterium]|nr:glycosyltransferase [Mycobacteriales bacterium]HWA68163.1 glycosyltransferase [Mycobacteriales bacterium]